MDATFWMTRLERADTSHLLLAALAGILLATVVLHRLGLIARVLRILALVVGGAIRGGFLLWERLLAWASWPLYLVIVVGLLLTGGAVGGIWPASRVLCGLAALFMGIIACLAYMFVDLERTEVERGYKAIHNPLKGQVLAMNLGRYGRRVGIPLLISAAVASIGGFALLNQGLHETIGRDWYAVADERREPNYADFLAYALTKILGIMDVLDLFRSHHVMGAAFVREAAWPASSLLAGFKVFFTLVLLHQIFASMRQGRLLAETITDFWSPHEPIHERARHALPVYGILAIRPLLGSMRQVPSLTREQRDQLPLILETIGPSIVPALIRHLHDPHEHVRAVVAVALGHLRAVESVSLLAALVRDPSEVVRRGAAEAMGYLASLGRVSSRARTGLGRGGRVRAITWYSAWRRRGAVNPHRDPIELAVSALETVLSDDSAAVRIQAVEALGRIGLPAAAMARRLIGMLKEPDETVRCQAAWALGQVGGNAEATVAALVELLDDASAPVKESAARALGAMAAAAAPAIPAIVALLLDGQESVRAAAADAIARVGPLERVATDALVEGLASPDNIVRAHTAEALGTIGAAAEDAAPALVLAMSDANDRVRSRAVEALGKIGESAAAAAVPGLMRALRDLDNGICALAAEALGQMGESADRAIPALVRSLRHISPEVRRSAAEALGKMGAAAAAARSALEAAASDEDGGVRSQAIRALGALGDPTPTSTERILAWFQDPDPMVRAAAVESSGRSSEPGEAMAGALMLLLDDPNDRVKVEVTKVLPGLTGATPAVIDGLCRRLLEDDSDWVQDCAAMALGKLGPPASPAGGALLHAARNGVVGVREQAMRAIARIQPPETAQALAAGLEDASGDVRLVASAGWMNATSIPDEAIGALVEALGDPNVQVRANCANALARLDAIPDTAVPRLIECAADANDGLRMNAAMALRLAPTVAVLDVMRGLVSDPNSRVRLIAAGSLLAAESDHGDAGLVLMEALEDPAPRVRAAAVELLASLDARGAALIEGLRERGGPLDVPAMKPGSGTPLATTVPQVT